MNICDQYIWIFKYSNIFVTLCFGCEMFWSVSSFVRCPPRDKVKYTSDSEAIFYRYWKYDNSVINVFVDIQVIYCEALPSIIEPIDQEVNTFFNHKSLKAWSLEKFWRGVGKFPGTNKCENMQRTNMVENEETNPACFIATGWCTNKSSAVHNWTKIIENITTGYLSNLLHFAIGIIIIVIRNMYDAAFIFRCDRETQYNTNSKTVTQNSLPI